MGQSWWLSGLAPPSAQGVILETRDRVPRRAPCMEPASPSAWVSTCHDPVSKQVHLRALRGLELLYKDCGGRHSTPNNSNRLKS